MIVFLVALNACTLLAVIVAQAWVHISQSRDWREERAYLLNATMARSLPELRGPIQHSPTTHEFSLSDLEGYESPVGL